MFKDRLIHVSIVSPEGRCMRALGSSNPAQNCAYRIILGKYNLDSCNPGCHTYFCTLSELPDILECILAITDSVSELDVLTQTECDVVALDAAENSQIPTSAVIRYF